MTKQKNWPTKKPQNIIVRMPNWLGDLVMATPVLHDLRHKFPDARITALCQSNVAGMLKADPNIDEIFSFKKPSGWIHNVQHGEIIESLYYGKYDLGILLTNSFSSAFWFWRGNVQNRLGFSTHWRSLLLNNAVPLPKNIESQHLVITYKMLLAPLGIPVSNTDPCLYVSPEEMAAARNILNTHGAIIGKNKIVGINPGAAFGTAKCWLPERFKEVTQRLIQDQNVRVVYFGDPAGTPLVNEICKGFGENVINLAGRTTLRELLALIKCCSVFLTNDSGPMHIASALGVPLIALFGSTSDVKTGPYKGGTVIHKHVECSPCYKRVCPIDFRCMKRIESDEVYSAIVKALKNSESRIQNSEV